MDFRKQATRLEVPVYFLAARDAPHKEPIWIEHSGHSPWVEEPEKVVAVMVNTVLKQTIVPSTRPPAFTRFRTSPASEKTTVRSGHTFSVTFVTWRGKTGLLHSSINRWPWFLKCCLAQRQHGSRHVRSDGILPHYIASTSSHS